MSEYGIHSITNNQIEPVYNIGRKQFMISMKLISLFSYRKEQARLVLNNVRVSEDLK